MILSSDDGKKGREEGGEDMKMEGIRGFDVQLSVLAIVAIFLLLSSARIVTRRPHDKAIAGKLVRNDREIEENNKGEYLTRKLRDNIWKFDGQVDVVGSLC